MGEIKQKTPPHKETVVTRSKDSYFARTRESKPHHLRTLNWKYLDKAQKEWRKRTGGSDQHGMETTHDPPELLNRSESRSPTREVTS